MNKIWLLACLILPIVFSCGDDEEDDGCPNVREANDNAIVDYLSQNNLTAEQGLDGLYFTIIEEGDGDRVPYLQENVEVNYKLYNLSDEIIEENNGANFVLNNTVTGFHRGVREITEGGRVIIYVPAHLGYGCSEPSNSNVLVFDVELIHIDRVID